MKHILFALMVLGTLSCTKETPTTLEAELKSEPVTELRNDSIFTIGNTYQVTAKDVGGYYTTTIEFVDATTYHMTFKRSAEYHAEWDGEWKLTGDKLRLEEQGRFIMSAELTKLSNMQPGFICERHNGVVEVYSVQ